MVFLQINGHKLTRRECLYELIGVQYVANRILKFGSTHHHPWFPGQCQRPPRNHSGPEGAIHRLFLQSSPIEVAC